MVDFNFILTLRKFKIIYRITEMKYVATNLTYIYEAWLTVVIEFIFP